VSNQYELRQFKLASGEEIVCEIVQWHNEEELELVIRKPMRLSLGEMETGVRYYAFRPWLVYAENPDEFVILNGQHVVGIVEPAPPLVKQWKEAVDEMALSYDERMKEHEEATGEKTQTMTEKMKEFLKQASEEEKKVLSQMESDSGDNNILKFDPGKRTIH
jgi:hypothetical protein